MRPGQEPVETATGCIMWLFAGTIGLVMTIPYIYLAGGSSGNARVTSWVFLFVSLLLYSLFHLVYRMRWAGGKVFWLFFGFWFLPIVANIVSIALSWAGLEMASGFIFNHRYTSLVAVPVLLVLFAAGFMAYPLAVNYWRALRVSPSVALVLVRRYLPLP
ncbi:MAG: hypothetical protein WD896_00950 [Parcubacteria group bacterium]